MTVQVGFERIIPTTLLCAARFCRLRACCKCPTSSLLLSGTCDWITVSELPTYRVIENAVHRLPIPLPMGKNLDCSAAKLSVSILRR
jgi:hypothetical protein